MSMPKDTKGTAPEDVEGHGFKYPRTDQEQATEQGGNGEDVEAHLGKWGSDESQANERRDSGEDVEGHGSRFNG